jgi:hypothetical protein
VLDAPVPEGADKGVDEFGFTGTFVSEDSVVSGSLQIRPGRVTLWVAGTELASWPPDRCRVERLTVARFAIQGDGETLTFTADDPAAVDQAISDYLHSPAIPPGSVLETATPAEETPVLKPEPGRGMEEATGTAFPVTPQPSAPSLAPPATRRPRIKTFRAKSDAFPPLEPQPEDEAGEGIASETAEATAGAATIADDVIAAARRRMKSIRASRWLKSDIQSVAVKGGAVAVMLLVLAAIGFAIFVLTGGLQDEPVPEPVPTTTIPPSTTTTTVPPAAPEPPTTLFETDPAELTERWNSLAEATRPELVLLDDLSPAFLISLTPFLTMEGLIDPINGSVTLRGVPTLTPEGDGSILTSLGLLIAMADPTLDGSDRRLLLNELGLDVRDPELGGIDGTVTYNGLTYRLFYQTDQATLVMTVAPQAAANLAGGETSTTTAP